MANEKSQTTVALSRTGDVASIEFSSPDGINIFSSRVVGELGEAVEKVATDAQARFVVLRAKGKVFLAGADIAQMQRFTQDEALAFARKGQSVFDALERLPQVTIAAISGHALGGGCEVALACDFRLTVATAKFGQPEVRLGLIPGWGGTQRLARYVPLGMARRLLFSGEQITAEAARALHLVDEVVADAAELEAAVQRWVTLLTPGSPAAVKHLKRAMLSGDEAGEFAKCFVGTEAREGTTAFLEKRAAGWTQRPPA
ncbi:MAG: enoyl-CoA hydratase/isomerase family protein [Phycisphaerales bacterium]|nr:enoyl-CoA hydratase/isomerase family protein [Phycisphaerales bacterium]